MAERKPIPIPLLPYVPGLELYSSLLCYLRFVSLLSLLFDTRSLNGEKQRKWKLWEPFKLYGMAARVTHVLHT